MTSAIICTRQVRGLEFRRRRFDVVLTPATPLASDPDGDAIDVAIHEVQTAGVPGAGTADGLVAAVRNGRDELEVVLNAGGGFAVRRI